MKRLLIANDYISTLGATFSSHAALTPTLQVLAPKIYFLIQSRLSSTFVLTPRQCIV